MIEIENNYGVNFYVSESIQSKLSVETDITVAYYTIMEKFVIYDFIHEITGVVGAIIQVEDIDYYDDTVDVELRVPITRSYTSLKVHLVFDNINNLAKYKIKNGR